MFLWSRTMSFANCAIIKPPADLVPLCPQNQPDHPTSPAPAWSVSALLERAQPGRLPVGAGRLVPARRPPWHQRVQQQAGHAVRRTGHPRAAARLPQDGGQGSLPDLLRHRPFRELPVGPLHRGSARHHARAVHEELRVQVRAHHLEHARGPALGVLHVPVPDAGLVPRGRLLRRAGGRAGPADPAMARLGRVRGPGLGRRGRQPGRADRGGRTRLPVRAVRSAVRLPGTRPGVHQKARAAGRRDPGCPVRPGCPGRAPAAPAAPAPEADSASEISD